MRQILFNLIFVVLVLQIYIVIVLLHLKQTSFWPANTVLTFVRYGQYWYLADNGTRTMAENAEKSATNFITEVSNDGIWVTPSDAKPVSGEAAATTSGWHISDTLDLFRQGTSMFKIWVEETVAKMRLGAENLSHLLFEESEIKFCNSTDWVGKFDLTSQEQGDGYLHKIDFDVNDGTEQGGGYGLHLQYNTDSDNSHLVSDLELEECSIPLDMMEE